VSVRKIGAGWENGWQVFIDNPPSGTQEKEDTVLQVYQALQKGYTFRGNNNFSNYISYLPNGQSNNAVGGSFAICDNADGSNIPHKNSSRLIIINGTGRVRVGIDKDNNGIPDKEDGANLTSCINP
jgi:type IV fimbrial biogenesis protein FimT